MQESLEFNNEIPQSSIEQQLDELRKEVDANLSNEELHAAVEDINEGTREFLENQMESDNPEIAKRAAFQHQVLTEMDSFLSEITPLIENEEFDRAGTGTQEFLNRQMSQLEDLGLTSEYAQKTTEEMGSFIAHYVDMLENSQLKDKQAWGLVSAGLDLVPYMGGAKMLAEGACGTTLDGTKMSTGQRIMHTAEGSFWIVVDASATVVGAATGGAGGAAVEGLKYGAQAGKVSKVMKRGAAVLRATGKGPKTQKAAKAIFHSSDYLARESAKVIEDGLAIRSAAGDVKQGLKIASFAKNREKNLILLKRIRDERKVFMKTLAEGFDQNQESSI